MVNHRSPRVIRSASTPSTSSSPSDGPSSSFYDRSVSIGSGEFAFTQSPAEQLEDPGTPRLFPRDLSDSAAGANHTLETSDFADFHDESSRVIRRASGDSAVVSSSRNGVEGSDLARDTAPLALRKPSEWAEWHCWRHGRQMNDIPKPSVEEIREALSATHIEESRKCIQKSAADAWAAQEEFKRGVARAMARHEAAANFMGGTFRSGSNSMIGRLFEHMKGKNSNKGIKA
ncbi:unnamed protein product [Closterium sp. Yama58-4]|nr:unnamed protein product [Closterium sp. Yama58-4]